MENHSRLGRRAFLGAFSGCAFCLSRSTKAQSIGILDPGIYMDGIQTVLRNGRKLIEPTLLPAELTIARSITYRVQRSSNANAFAAWEDGNRLVLINAGMIAVFDWIADALIMDKDLGYTGCLEAYGNYLGQGIIDNSMRAQQGVPLAPVFVPGTYAVQIGGPCSGFTASQFTARPELGQVRARMMEASIMFVYLHELGHHVLNHVPTDMVDTADKSMHRSQEDAADRWAILAALRAGYLLNGAYPWTIFVALLGGNSLEAEIQSTHPLGIRRDLLIYEQTLSYLQTHRTTWKGDDASYQGALSHLQQSVVAAKQLIDDLQN